MSIDTEHVLRRSRYQTDTSENDFLDAFLLSSTWQDSSDRAVRLKVVGICSIEIASNDTTLAFWAFEVLYQSLQLTSQVSATNRHQAQL